MLSIDPHNTLLKTKNKNPFYIIYTDYTHTWLSMLRRLGHSTPCLCQNSKKIRSKTSSSPPKNSRATENIVKYSGGERRTVKQRKEAVNEEWSNAGGHWHPFAGTPACQVVGFTLEPLGFALKRLRWLEGSYSWLQSGSHCLGHWREGKAGWMEGKQEEYGEEEEARGRAASGSRELGQRVEKDEWAGGCCCALRGLRRNPPTVSLLHTVLKVLPGILLLSWHLMSIF